MSSLSARIAVAASGAARTIGYVDTTTASLIQLWRNLCLLDVHF
jgi:hypothetical protein